jgi:hypothetical protein
MTDIVKKYIVYPGIEEPITPAQVKVEICGLKNAIKIAEELVSRLEQVLTIVDMKQAETIHEQRQKGETEKSPAEGEKRNQD